MRLLTLLLCLVATADAQLRILAIGDSLTDEYGSLSTFFSAPDSDPTNARAENWPELIEAHRPLQASLGPTGGYPDGRVSGFRRNFGIITLEADTWVEVLDTTPAVFLTGDPQLIGYYQTKQALEQELGNSDIAVIFLGGNDLNSVYSSVYSDTAPPGTLTAIADDIMAIHAWVRAEKPGLPIVVCTVPDVGATPQKSSVRPDPEPARALIRNMNLDLIDRIAARPNTAVARIDALTDRVFDQQPFHINGTLFTIAGDPENPPDHVFTKDDFHPNTVAQAFIANEIFAAINTLLPGSLTLFSNREILQTVLGLNPDQPYLEYIASHSPAASGPDDDPDGDGLPNLVEMALGTALDSFSSPLTGTWQPGGGISYTADPVALRYLELIPQESTTLADWQAVPADRMTPAGPIPPADTPNSFFRLKAIPRP